MISIIQSFSLTSTRRVIFLVRLNTFLLVEYSNVPITIKTEFDSFWFPAHLEASHKVTQKKKRSTEIDAIVHFLPVRHPSKCYN